MRSFASNSSKRISFILATKNRARFLEKSLSLHRSLIGQRDELIVVDGGSRDDTIGVIKKKLDIVDTFISEKDTSEGHAVNKGVLLSRGQYIKLLTDDDIFHKEAIEEAYKIMEENPDIDVLLCGGVKKRGKEIGYVWVPKGVIYGGNAANVFKYGGCGLGLLVRRGIFSKVGLFNPMAVALDVDFLVKAISSGASVKFCRLNMYLHNVEKHSAVSSRKDKLDRDFRRIKRAYGVRGDLFWFDFKNQLTVSLYTLVPSRLILFLKKILKREQKVIEPVWDGGLS